MSSESATTAVIVEDELVSLESFGPERFSNRELSFLDFTERLLDLADDESLPLLERVKFLAIFASGTDEFFQVRVAGLKDQLAAQIGATSPDGRTPSQQLAAIRARTLALVERHSAIFTALVHPALASADILVSDYGDLDAEARTEVRQIFERDLFPVLTPLSVDSGHPFPYISNLSLNLAVDVEDPVTGESRFARVKVPPLLARFVPLADGRRLVPLEQVIAANLDALFPEMRIGAHFAFRVTRSAEVEFEETDAEDLLEAVELELRRRRFGRAVRLEVDPEMRPHLVTLLLEELELTREDLYAPSAPLDLAQLWSLVGLDRPDLKERPYVPVTPPRLGGDQAVDFFSVIAERDLLVHHPYESFSTSVEAFIAQAAADPDVLAIKQTLYRTSGDAPFVSALAQAAEEGKQVAALIELTARFDEQRNIAWARQLEQAGVHVVYGVVGLKTHAKTILVVRREQDGIHRYCHIGTGNYNSDTARTYEDLGLFTCDEDVGSDLTNLFNHLTGFSHAATTRALVLAPDGFRPWVLSEIATEADAGADGRIVIKVNGLTDPEVIDALYAASHRGCQISLIVRGVCSLRPGVEHLSETITVRSIIGRYLEHSRIYRFGTPSATPRPPNASDGEDSPLPGVHPARYFIGSADLMQRNLDYRIEAITPVRDPELCAYLEGVLDLTLADDTFTWTLDSSGRWTRVPNVLGISLQERLAQLALERGHRRVHDGIA